MSGIESRAAVPGLGKCTEELKTVVPEEVKEEFAALAVLAGQRPADYLRDLILEHMYGSLHVARIRNARRNGMAGTGLNQGDITP